MQKPGANHEKISEAAKRGSEALKCVSSFTERVRPYASEAADKVVDILNQAKQNPAYENIKDKGLMTGGAVLAADGVRRIARKDEDGKRHLVRGVSQTAIGVGIFTATVINSRSNTSGNEGPER